MVKITETEKEEIKQNLKKQLAILNTQEFIHKMTEKCFKSCIDKPGTKLSNHDRNCLAMCMDRFMDSWNLISTTYSNRIIRESQNQENFN